MPGVWIKVDVSKGGDEKETEEISPNGISSWRDESTGIL
jgi:hypothetical protein